MKSCAGIKNIFIKRLAVLLILPLSVLAFCLIYGKIIPRTIPASTTQTPILLQASASPTPTQTPEPTGEPTVEATLAPTVTPEPTRKPGIPQFKTPTEPTRYHIEISIAAQIVYIYELQEDGSKGDLAKAILCSTGGWGVNETPKRKWVVLDNGMEKEAVRNGWGLSRYEFEWFDGKSTGQYMTRLWKVETDAETGEEYIAPSGYLMHSVPYSKLDKNTLKTAEWNKLGRRASTGCIRMNVEDAKWIYDYVAAYSYVYTIEGTPDPELWAALKLPDLPLDVTRDPTDVF
ncbi:MAG: L,D-transpeptidase [Clostridia bacterium]|nr:L,D-transpeptidase [Clostridia bacterium]